MKKYVFILLVSFLFFNPHKIEANPVKQKFEQGMVAFMQKDYAKAIIHYEEVLKMFPKFAPAYFYLGQAHRQLGTNKSQVSWLFEQAVEIDPNHEKAHEQLSKVYYELGQFEQAEEHGLRAIELNPKNIAAQLSVGWIYLLGKSEPRAAIDHFENALKIQEQPYAYLGLGMAYYMDDQRFQVLDIITKLKKMGQDKFANQLETMVREGKRAPSSLAGSPLLSRPRQTSSLVRDVPPTNYPTLTGNAAVENMPVRLSGRMPKGLSENPQVNSTQEPSGADRIRALQRQSQANSKGSSY